MNILVTGGANGIGKATVQILLEKDHTVEVLDNDDEALQKLPDSVGKHPGDVREEKVVEVVKEIDFEVLINCAGFQEQGSVEDMSLEKFQEHVETNYYGTVRTVKASLRQLKKKNGRIINVSSIAGKSTMPFLGAYSASKHAVEGFSDALRMEMSEFDVDVVLIEPGPIETGFNKRAIEALEKYIPESEYSDDYERRMTTDGFNGVGPDKAAYKIVKAVEARNPNSRYTVTWQAWFIAKFKYFIPNSIFDKMARRI